MNIRKRVLIIKQKMEKLSRNNNFRKGFWGLVALVSSVLTANGDIQGKPVLQIGNNPYGWSNLPAIVSNVTDNPANQTGSYSNSFRVRCQFSNLPIETTNSYTMNIFSEDGQLYASTKIPTNGRTQCDLFVDSPSLSNPSASLNANSSLYLSINQTNGLAYALPFTGLRANAGENLTLADTNTSHAVIGSIDSDGDTQRNDEEMFVGTDPYDSSDFFRITNFSQNNNFLTLRWNGSSNTLVDVCESNTLLSNQCNIVKHNALKNSTTMTRSGTPKFYRLKAIGSI